jgi:hypothetical protein
MGSNCISVSISLSVYGERKKEEEKKETLKKNARAMYYIKRENGRLPNPKITVDRVLFSY